MYYRAPPLANILDRRRCEHPWSTLYTIRHTILYSWAAFTSTRILEVERQVRAKSRIIRLSPPPPLLPFSGQFEGSYPPYTHRHIHVQPQTHALHTSCNVSGMHPHRHLRVRLIRRALSQRALSCRTESLSGLVHALPAASSLVSTHLSLPLSAYSTNRGTCNCKRAGLVAAEAPRRARAYTSAWRRDSSGDGVRLLMLQPRRCPRVLTLVSSAHSCGKMYSWWRGEGANV